MPATGSPLVQIVVLLSAQIVVILSVQIVVLRSTQIVVLLSIQIVVLLSVQIAPFGQIKLHVRKNLSRAFRRLQVVRFGDFQ